MLDEILEFILEIISLPFESEIDHLFTKTNRIQSRAIRIILKIFLFLLFIAFLLTLFSLLKFFITGSWK